MKTGMAPGVTPCPSCKQIGLEFEMRFKESTTRSSTLTGRDVPHLYCKARCGWETWGRTEPGYVVFSFDPGDAA